MQPGEAGGFFDRDEADAARVVAGLVLRGPMGGDLCEGEGDIFRSAAGSGGEVDDRQSDLTSCISAEGQEEGGIDVGLPANGMNGWQAQPQRNWIDSFEQGGALGDAGAQGFR